MDCQLHCTIRGRVQGVGFRYFVLQQANIHSLTGWVRNTKEGTVEVIAEGEKEPVESFLHALHNGPSPSKVEGVSVEWNPATHAFPVFRILK